MCNPGTLKIKDDSLKNRIISDSVLVAVHGSMSLPQQGFLYKENSRSSSMLKRENQYFLDTDPPCAPALPPRTCASLLDVVQTGPSASGAARPGARALSELHARGTRGATQAAPRRIGRRLGQTTRASWRSMRFHVSLFWCWALG